MSLHYSHLMTPLVWALSHTLTVSQALVTHQSHVSGVAGLSEDLLLEAQCFSEMMLSPSWKRTVEQSRPQLHVNNLLEQNGLGTYTVLYKKEAHLSGQ